MNDTATGSWKLERDSDGIAWLTIDKPGSSANVLSSSVLSELQNLSQNDPDGLVRDQATIALRRL